jgi:transposase
MVEAENVKLHRNADEIKLRRSQSDVTQILTTLHARAEKMIIFFILNGRRGIIMEG